MKKAVHTLILLVFIVACSFLLPTKAQAANIASGTCGDNLTWTMSDRYTLTISGTGAMDEFGYGRAPWGDYLIRYVDIEEGVTSIGSYAFYAKSLISIQIPNSVTSIGYSAFKNCNNLRFLTIGNGLTTIGDEAFSNCNSLRSVTIPDSVTSMGSYAFRDCTSITSVTIGNAVTSIGNYAFSNCTSMTSVTIGSAVTSIGDYAFAYCSGLTGVTIPTSVINIGDSAFYYCTGLTEITIPGSVKSIGAWAFHACFSVTDIMIESGVTSIGIDAFSNCNKLTSVTIPDSVTSIGDYAFYDCGSLTSIIIPDGVNNIEKCTFEYCTSLTSITIPGSVKGIDESAFYGCSSLAAVWYNGTEEQWTEITFGSYNDALTGANVLCWNIDEEGTLTVSGTGPMISYDSCRLYPWYSRSASVKKVVINSGVTTVANQAFYNYPNLQAATIPDSVTSIGEWAFSGCASLTNITIPGSVTSISRYTFFGCTGLTDVIISDGVTNIGSGAFFQCTSLTYITIPDSVASISLLAFDTCTSLTDVYYGGTEEQWAGISISDSNTPLTNATIHFSKAAYLRFSSAALTLYDNISVEFKVDNSLFAEGAFTDPYVVFVFNGVETKVDTYTVDEDRYVFTFSDVAPDQMTDTISATLYATYNGEEYVGKTKEYSVSEYCYSMLAEYSADEYAELRTLLVDLLNYGAASQTYTGYKSDALVNASLTATQLQWSTSAEPTLETVLDTAYKTVENPTAKWKGAGLQLQESVEMRLKFTAESIEGLSVKIESGTNTWTIASDKFVAGDGVYYVYFTGLDASQMRQNVYLTICDGDIPVSNTVCYSIGSYAYEKQNSTIAGLPELVKAMMKYGDSAYAYVH